ncbi:MAG: ribonuclease III [Planctomycetes bacterium]|nr:ribonuclease III [Planctomycetota bacterium]
MDQQTIQRCRELLDYEFRDIDLLELATTHSSFASSRIESNERLEFLGDAVLGLVVVQELYRRYPDLSEGEMTKIKSAVVSRRICAVAARKAGLSGQLLLGRGMNESRERPMSVAAGFFEAIVGAIYLDGGLDEARRFILRLMLPHVEEAFANEHQHNYKSLLQQHAQREMASSPEYQILDEKGPDHSKCFEIAAVINGRQFASAWGRSKKQAEQEAARKALVELGLLQDDGRGAEPDEYEASDARD